MIINFDSGRCGRQGSGIGRCVGVSGAVSTHNLDIDNEMDRYENEGVADGEDKCDTTQFEVSEMDVESQKLGWWRSSCGKKNYHSCREQLR